MQTESIWETLKKLEFEQNAQTEETLVRLTKPVSTQIYKKVKTTLQNLGGVWKGGKLQAHIFEYNPKEDIEETIRTEKLPPKNPLDFFPTPDSIIEHILQDSSCACIFTDWGEIAQSPMKILEPSAGEGNIVKNIIKRYPHLKGKIDSIECHPQRMRKVQALQAGETYKADFLTWEPDELGKYQAIIMNPPFEKGVYLQHVQKAWGILQEVDKSTTLVTIVPANWKTGKNRKEKEFQNLVAQYGSYWENPEESFYKVGTKTATDTIVLEKPKNGGINPKEQPREGYSNFHIQALDYTINSDSKLNQEQIDLEEQIQFFKITDANSAKSKPEIMQKVNQLLENAQKELIQNESIILNTKQTQEQYLDYLLQS